MQITTNTLDTGAGPADWFTGSVYIDTVAWHTHPHGQTIWVSEGVGLCQREGGEVEVIRPGDRVFFEPGEEHWHGAARTRFMTHLAMLVVGEDGTPATWGDHVTDEEYAAAPEVEG